MTDEDLNEMSADIGAVVAGRLVVADGSIVLDLDNRTFTMVDNRPRLRIWVDDLVGRIAGWFRPTVDTFEPDDWETPQEFEGWGRRNGDDR